MTDLEIFKEHYRCTVEETDRKSFQRVMLPLVIGSTPFNPDVEYGTEKVCAIYITESMLEDLLKTSVDTIKEENRRKNDKKLMDLYTAYKMMDLLLK